ncbi:hypothetical protein BCR39DRAFT_545311 [Naematelia encephala]|uniref:Magnesium transporter n=1 Tax=Naematelia encephala TaxID=71784 RepID=A0A1Y2AR40_9TREE|nr:hypothetical protein BCR39DRAFT_545311 [Naematelia encephala]
MSKSHILHSWTAGVGSCSCRYSSPPSFLLPRRAFFTRRSATSATTPFFLPSSVSATAAHVPDELPPPLIPTIHPVPRIRAQTGPAPNAPAAGPSSDVEGRRNERKQRYLDSLMDKAGELSLRCSVLDSEGNWTAEEGRYKKTELCKEHDLDPRDLRKLDSLTPNLVPVILTRRTCILISMLHIRALIKPDRVIVFDTAGRQESEVQRKFRWRLERNVRAGLKTGCGEDGEDGEEEIGLNYEHRALESILVSCANALEEEMGFTRQLVQALLADLEDDINRETLKRLLHYSRRLVGFQSRARYVKRAVDEVLESDEDLSAMYLTSRALGKPRALHDHEQLEMLLESFVKQVEEIVSEIDNTVANMQATQEIAELMLDSGRNALLALDVKISIATLGIGTGALIAGIFGMNLATDLETHPQAFWVVSGGATFIAFIVFLYGVRILRRVRRVALSGNRPPSLSRLMRSRIWDSSVAQIAAISDPSVPLSIPRSHLFHADFWNSKNRRNWWDKIFRRPGAGYDVEPVWINKQADQARARDAFRFQQMSEREQKAAERRLKHEQKGFEDFQRAWKDDWSGSWKWEKRGKWLKD